MADVFSPEKRSEVMACIRSRGNRETELAMIRLFRVHKITGWRRHWPLHGRPDFVFPKLKVAVFVDGCFWHGCPLHGTQPASNADYWRTKLTRNRERDRAVGRQLRSQGWRVLRLWQHELSRSNEARCMARIRRVLTYPNSVERADPSSKPRAAITATGCGGARGDGEARDRN